MSTSPLAGLPGVVVAGARDTGTGWQWTFVLAAGHERAAIEAILARMAIGDEVALEDPLAGECWRELRRPPEGGWQRKRGCHGAHGTWRDCDAAEALAWLLEVACSDHGGAGRGPAYWTRPKALRAGAR